MLPAEVELNARAHFPPPIGAPVHCSGASMAELQAAFGLLDLLSAAKAYDAALIGRLDRLLQD